LVVLQHPVTTEYADARTQVRETLAAVEALAQPTFWFWPNVDAGSDGTSKAIRQFRELRRVPFIYFLKNLPPEDFLRLLRGARCLIGNSSAGIRESSFLGLPAVNIGSRQAGRERGPNVLDVDYERAAIVAATRRQLDGGRYAGVPLYGDGKAGERIAGILARAPLTVEKRITY
jgi:UDP-N-acetylglucosamine 2-epimerase